MLGAVYYVTSKNTNWVGVECFKFSIVVWHFEGRLVSDIIGCRMRVEVEDRELCCLDLRILL